MSRWIKEIIVRYDDKQCFIYGNTVGEVVGELVRCAECKFKSLYDDGETKYYYCALEDRPNRQWSVDDWNFCFWGERKEGE